MFVYIEGSLVDDRSSTFPQKVNSYINGFENGFGFEMDLKVGNLN